MTVVKVLPSWLPALKAEQNDPTALELLKQQDPPVKPVYTYHTQRTSLPSLRRTVRSSIGQMLFRAPLSHGRADQARATIKEGKRKYWRFTLNADGNRVDAVMTWTSATMEKGRWMLVALGLTEIYECQIGFCKAFDYSYKRFHKLSKCLSCNMLFFNYPGMAKSTGPLIPETLVAAHRAATEFLLDPHTGICPKQVIFYGHSMGGAVQTLSLEDLQPQQGVQYVKVSDRTFSSLGAIVGSVTWAGPAVWVLRSMDWDISPLKAASKSTMPEVVISRVKTQPGRKKKISQEEYNDDIIPFDGSLAKGLSERACSGKKILLGVTETHETPVQDTDLLAEAIEECFQEQ